MKRWPAAFLLIGILNAPSLAAREFNSSLKLKIFLRGTGGAPDQMLGFTPARPHHPVFVPDEKLWYVRPIGPLNALSLDALARLIQAHHVPGLDLSDHWELSNASLAHLRSLDQLRMLDISQTAISDAGILSLRDHPQLAILLLPEGTTDHALDVLADLPALRELNLDRAHITDQGLSKLAALPLLEILDLSATEISDAGIASLGKLPHLKQLVLGGTITDAGAPFLRELKSLEDIDISQTQIRENGLAALAALPRLRTVYVNRQTSDEGLARLAKSKSLRALDLSHTAITDAGVKSLTQAKALEEISFSQTAIGNESLTSLAKLPDLRMVDFSETQVTSVGLAPLAHLAKLQVLSLSWQKLTREDLHEMAKLKQLKTIVLNGVALPEVTMAQLRHLGTQSPWEQVPGLERARLSESPIEDASVLAAPSPFPGRVFVGSAAQNQAPAITSVPPSEIAATSGRSLRPPPFRFETIPIKKASTRLEPSKKRSRVLGRLAPRLGPAAIGPVSPQGVDIQRRESAEGHRASV